MFALPPLCVCLPATSNLSIILPRYSLSSITSQTSTMHHPRISSFQILSTLVTAKKKLNTIISATSSFASCLFLSAAVSKPNSIDVRTFKTLYSELSLPCGSVGSNSRRLWVQSLGRPKTMGMVAIVSLPSTQVPVVGLQVQVSFVTTF